VLREGEVRTGDVVMVVERDLRAVSITFANTILHRDSKDREGIMRVLSLTALSESWQRFFQELLHKA